MNAQKLGKPLVAAITTVVLAGGAVNAQAQVIVDGCVYFNTGAEDGQYVGRSIDAQSFEAGDTITFAAGPPVLDPDPSTEISLAVGNPAVQVDNDVYPGTLTYTFGGTTSAVVAWTATSSSDPQTAPTWTATCERDGGNPSSSTSTTSTTTSSSVATTSSTVAPTTTTAVSATTTAIPALGAFGIPLLAGIMAVIGMLGFSRRR